MHIQFSRPWRFGLVDRWLEVPLPRPCVCGRLDCEYRCELLACSYMPYWQFGPLIVEWR